MSAVPFVEQRLFCGTKIYSFFIHYYFALNAIYTIFAHV